MSAREAADESRRKPLLGVLFWVGVGLAPLAALLLLLGQGNGPLRIAAVLAVLAVVLIGLSITLGRGADDARLDLEETFLEEIDDLRGELRNDIATAARATHKAFGEKLEAVQGNVDALRGQLDAVRAEAESGRTPAARPTAAATVGTAVASAAVGGAAVAGAVAPGRARVEADQAGWASTASDRPGWSPSDTASAGWGPGASAPGMPARNDAEARGDARAWGDGGARDEGRRDAAGYGDAWRAEVGPGPARGADQGRAGRFPVQPRAGFDAAGSDGGGYPDDEPTGAGRTTHGRADAEPDLGSGPPPGQYGRPAGQPWAQAGPQHAGPQRAGPQRAGPQHAGSQYGGPQYGGQHSGLSGRHFGPGVVRHTETVQVTTRQTIVGGHEDAPLTGGGYGAGGYGGAGQSGTHGGDTHGGGTYGGGTYGGGAYGGGGSHGGGTYGGGSNGGGVYGGAGQGGDHGDGAYNAGGRDGGTYGAGRPDRDQRGGDRDERERDRDDRGGNPDERGGERDGRNRRAGWGWRPGGSDDGAGDDRQTGGGGWRERFADPEPETGDPADDSYWAELRAGDRWTSVRADERGREVRMGERRASMRSDESGTELRVEDRWAEVRQQEPRTDDARRAGRQWPESRDEERRPSGQRGSGDWSAADDGRRADRRDDGRGVEAGDGQGWERPGTAPALPSGGVGQAALWGTPRQEPDAEPDRRSRRQREDEEYGYPPLDESPRAGGTRRSGYNYADDSWR